MPSMTFYLPPPSRYLHEMPRACCGFVFGGDERAWRRQVRGKVRVLSETQVLVELGARNPHANEAWCGTRERKGKGCMRRWVLCIYVCHAFVLLRFVK